VDVVPRDMLEKMETAARVGGVNQKGVECRLLVGGSKLRLCGMPQSLRTSSLVRGEAVESANVGPVVNTWGHALQVVCSCLDALGGTDPKLVGHNELSASGARGEVSGSRCGDPKWVLHIGIHVGLGVRGGVCGGNSSRGWGHGRGGGLAGISGNAQRREWWHGEGRQRVAGRGWSHWGRVLAEGGWTTVGATNGARGRKARGSALGRGAVSWGLVRGGSGRGRARIAGLPYSHTPEAPDVGNNSGHILTDMAANVMC
jgi:hypothetical protein